MAKSKYETHVLPNLDKIIKWAKDGATAKEIAANLHIAYSTFRKYLDEGQEGDERYEGVYVNRFLSSTFTPGSVFKTVTRRFRLLSRRRVKFRTSRWKTPCSRAAWATMPRS